MSAAATDQGFSGSKTDSPSAAATDSKPRSEQTKSVYQGRFTSFPIQEGEHFLTVCRYVEHNALRANLVAQAQNCPRSRWSAAPAGHRRWLVLSATDFLNCGEKGKIALGRGTLSGFKAPFDFHEFDNKSRSFVPITDEERILAIGRQIHLSITCLRTIHQR